MNILNKKILQRVLCKGIKAVPTIKNSENVDPAELELEIHYYSYNTWKSSHTRRSEQSMCKESHRWKDQSSAPIHWEFDN